MAKKTTLILSVSYHGAQGVVPAGQPVELSAKEAKEFLAQGLGRKPGAEMPAPAPVDAAEVEALRAKLAALQVELKEVQLDREERLAEAQAYAVGLEDRLREAGLFEDAQPDAAKK